MWETQAQFNVFMVLSLFLIGVPLWWFSDQNRRIKATSNIKSTIKNLDYASLKQKAQDFLEKYFKKPEMNLDEVANKITDFRVAQQRYNEAAERARFALQSNKEQSEEACVRAEIILQKTESAQASRSFQQVFMDAKPEIVGTHVFNGCVLLAKQVLKVELWDLLNQGVKMGVAVSRPRRDEPFTVQGIVLYIQLKKYMQLICLTVDAKFRKDNIESTLNEAFIKATKKIGHDIVIDLPSDAPFTTVQNMGLGYKLLQKLGYTVHSDKEMASFPLSATKGKKAVVFDPKTARDSIRKWDLLIRPTTVVTKKKVQKKKLATAQLPKNMQAASPVVETSIPSNAKAEDTAKAEDKSEKTAAENPVEAATKVVAKKEIKNQAPVKDQVVRKTEEAPKKTEVAKAEPAKVEDAVKETPIQWSPRYVPKIVDEEKVVKEETKEKITPRLEENKEEVKKSNFIEMARNHRQNLKSRSPVKADKDKKAKKAKKANPVANGTDAIDDKLLVQETTSTTDDGDNRPVQEIKKKTGGWKPSLKGSMGLAAKRLAALSR